MRTLIVDRFEGNYVICEELIAGKPARETRKKDKELHFFGIDKAELPQEVKEGDVLHISDDGVITVDAAETKTRRDIIQEKQKMLKK